MEALGLELSSSLQPLCFTCCLPFNNCYWWLQVQERRHNTVSPPAHVFHFNCGYILCRSRSTFFLCKFFVDCFYHIQQSSTEHLICQTSCWGYSLCCWLHHFVEERDTSKQSPHKAQSCETVMERITDSTWVGESVREKVPFHLKKCSNTWL